ncbi:uncharacterized protein BX663DRAFT_551827 [Cokeromyces recurvatus]|uniref:uncharacterized protein n=1 Tax=Cokeromyces recurvatus TaxID=90255 RepID=UPI00221FB1A0|nr:uncharacterized protein BX663DRAFT_551827 [Cokeromyces recurvatus]KAI7902965.1 hypothetical protein BX663DRAFT_551827 [Cokeromyces recurvatus]
MDFTSIPFQTLLIDTANDEQLLGYLTQLDQQYRNATDIQVRFDSLQIMLPIFKAHLIRLSDPKREQDSIEQFLLNWLQLTALRSKEHREDNTQQECMTLLRKLFAYVMARHILLYSQDDNFGEKMIITTLTYLVNLMDTEPDLVDLKPLEFIESNLSDRHLWNKYIASQLMTANENGQRDQLPSLSEDNWLDLTSTIELLQLFVRDLNENQEWKDIKKRDIYPWIDLIFTVAVSMVPCTDIPARTKLNHDLLPNLFRWQQNSLQQVEIKKQIDWCEMIWSRTLQMFALPAINLLRLEIYGLIARFFEFYFGIKNETDKNESNIILKDLRFNQDFFNILQSGLKSNDSSARKYSSYILKRIIDFTDKHPPQHDDSNKWLPYFRWSSEHASRYLTFWDDWFLLYDIMHENVIHLVDPVLPRFELILKETDSLQLDPSWWILLFYRGFENDTPSVKKCLLEYIFGQRQHDVLNKLAIQPSFMFDALLKVVDNTSLFQVPTIGTMVSPFGEHFKTFMTHLIHDGFVKGQEEERTRVLRQLICHLSRVVNSPLPILYAMEALAEVDERVVDAWGPEELKSLRILVDRHRNFNISTTKQFLRKLGIQAVVKLSNTALLSFSDIAKTISSLVNEYPVKTNSREFKLLRYWLENKISKDQSISTILDGLKERIKTYVYDLETETIPEAILRNQANVLVRTSIFVIMDKNGQLDMNRALDLFSVFSKQLKDSSRLLTLLNALWENWSHTFEETSGKDLLKLIGLDDTSESIFYILERIDKNYLIVSEVSTTDDDVLELYLSLTKYFLLSLNGNKKQQQQLIQNYYNKCLELIQYRSSMIDPNHEMLKATYLHLLSIVYEVARQPEYIGLLACDSTITDMVVGLQMKRTQEALRNKTWGDSVSTFIRNKWNCIENIVRYAAIIKKKMDQDPSLSYTFFEPSTIYEEAVEQLECSSEQSGESIIRSFGPLLAFPSWDKTAELVNLGVDRALAFMEEYAQQSKTFPLLFKAFIDVLFQPELLSIPELNNSNEAPLKRALQKILDVSEIKPFFAAQTAHLLHAYWSTFTNEANQSMLNYIHELRKLLVFGPLRDRDDQKLEAALATKIASPEEISASEGTVESVFSQNDYLVRVKMNDLLLRLDGNNKDHVELANLLLDNFLDVLNNSDLFENTFVATVEHRLKIRICCSMLLIIDFASEDKLNNYMEIIFDMMRKETVPSVRCYIEWSMVRLLRRFPDRLPLYYSKLDDTSHKPNYVISLLTIAFTLGEVLPSEHGEVKDYFDTIFVRLVPWLITNHFVIRLFAFCAWRRNWQAYIKRGYYNKDEQHDPYIASILKFMETYSDCKKFFDKIDAHFYMSRFDPLQDFNIEFIFRQMMTEFDMIHNEKIGSRAFIQVNSKVVDRCPFENSSRKSVYTCADPTEKIGTLVGDEEEEEERLDKKESEMNPSEDVYQKKIMPWEMMLETDMDMTKSLVKKNSRRRNDLIVVASLIDRLPNLAGLCRTCEIFNASQLVVPTLKIKQDPGFTSISVASEKWMPMVEVGPNDVAAFLAAKKDEGYTLCGLEQTTTSVRLDDPNFEFPEKCILLLGKEREGVPADLLQMLDITIEIPQYGITRSLNVHVSGAICIYEYTKQMSWKQQQILDH